MGKVQVLYYRKGCLCGEGGVLAGTSSAVHPTTPPQMQLPTQIIAAAAYIQRWKKRKE